MKVKVRIILVSVVLHDLTIPRDREPRFVLQRRETREAKPEIAGLWFDEKAFAVLKEHDPRVADSISSRSSEYDPGVEPHREQLTPGPKGEILAVTRFPLLEFFWRLPIVFFTEQRLVRNSAATAEKLANLLETLALNREWLTDITAHRKCGMRSLTS